MKKNTKSTDDRKKKLAVDSETKKPTEPALKKKPKIRKADADSEILCTWIMWEADQTDAVKMAKEKLSEACRVVSQAFPPVVFATKWQEAIDSLSNCARGYIRELWTAIRRTFIACDALTNAQHFGNLLDLIVAAVDVPDSPLEHKSIVRSVTEMLSNDEEIAFKLSFENTLTSTRMGPQLLTMLQGAIDRRLATFKVHEYLQP